MRKGILATEDVESFGLDADPIIVEAVETPEEIFGEQENTMTKIDALGADIDEANMTAVTLEKIHGSVEGSLDTGGLNEGEVRALEVAVEHLMARVGFAKSRKTFPALESFKEKGADRLNATQVAMENIKEGFDAIWKKVMDALRALWKHVSTFFKNIFGASVKVKEQAADLKEKAKKSTIPAGEREIKAGKYVKLLMTDSGFLKGPALISAYEALIKDPVISRDRTDVINKVGSLLKEQIAEQDDDKKGLISDKMAEILINATQANVGESVDPKLIDLADKAIVYRYNLPFGHMSFWTVGYLETSMLMVKLSPTTDKELTFPELLPALESADVIKLTDLVSKHMDFYKVTVNHLDHAIDKLSAMVDSIKTVASDEDTKTANQIFHNITNVVLQSEVLLRGYDTKISKAILDHCNASLDVPKAEKPTI